MHLEDGRTAPLVKTRSLATNQVADGSSGLVCFVSPAGGQPGEEKQVEETMAMGYKTAGERRVVGEIGVILSTMLSSAKATALSMMSEISFFKRCMITSTASPILPR